MKSFPYRERGLNLMEERFGNNLIQKYIKNKLKSKKEVRVLEIGFGEGKGLLDLRELFPDKNLLLYGINDKKKANVHKKLDLLKNVRRFNLSISKDSLPNIYFYDAGEGLKFNSNYFDLIISQVSFHYVGNKAKLLEEIWRTLKFEGKAFLHIDLDYKKESPDFMKLNKETPLFIIYNKGKLVKLSSYLKTFKNKGFDITLKNSKNKKYNRILSITKNQKKTLNLNLKYDGNSTLYLTKLRDTDKYKKDKSIWWGTRSVFFVNK